MKNTKNEIAEKLGDIESILQDLVMVHDTRDLEYALKNLENAILVAALVVAKPKNPHTEIANMYAAVEKFRKKQAKSNKA